MRLGVPRCASVWGWGTTGRADGDGRPEERNMTHVVTRSRKAPGAPAVVRRRVATADPGTLVVVETYRRSLLVRGPALKDTGERASLERTSLDLRPGEVLKVCATVRAGRRRIETPRVARPRHDE